MSVSGTRLMKTGTPATSVSARLPPMPEPRAGAAAIASLSLASLSRESSAPTAACAA